jgi:hypothetical protein
MTSPIPEFQPFQKRAAYAPATLATWLLIAKQAIEAKVFLASAQYTLR